MIFENQSIGLHMGVYVGEGTSHSWTWFADIFDRAGYYSVSFLTEKDIEESLLTDCDILFVSGGDTFAIAESLDRSGAEQIEKFVRNGGIYIGTCAGAYLPLKSSLSPLNMFNFVHARITNLSKHLPSPKIRPEKFCTEYGCQYVFHPVREEVSMKVKGWSIRKEDIIKAPLYGGPILLVSDDIEVLAEYSSFTRKTEFLIDEDLAWQTIIGNVAVARKKLGKGMFYLFGPHFEHPDYPDANQFLFDILFRFPWEGQVDNGRVSSMVSGCQRPCSKKLFRTFLSQISNARIIALALERTSYKWLIGKKVYEPEKIRVFLEAIWPRARCLELKKGYIYISEEVINKLIGLFRDIIQLLQQLKNDTEPFQEERKTASHLFFCLREATSKFLSQYFRLNREGVMEPKGTFQCRNVSSQPQLSPY